MFGSFNAAIAALISIALAVVPVVEILKGIFAEKGRPLSEGSTLIVVMLTGMVLAMGYFYFPDLPTMAQVPIAGAAIALDAAGIFKLSGRPTGNTSTAVNRT
jgi:ABC-type Fe3+ transport system permease subunit